MIGNHCPIAPAAKEKFPDIYASGTHIHLFGDEKDENFALPQEAINFIHRFDALVDTPRRKNRVAGTYF